MGRACSTNVGDEECICENWCLQACQVYQPQVEQLQIYFIKHLISL
jgi:hypothetical protein